MSDQQTYDSGERQNGSEFTVTERAKADKQRRPTMGRRRGKTPQSFNGMHRRRRRKMTW